VGSGFKSPVQWDEEDGFCECYCGDEAHIGKRIEEGKQGQEVGQDEETERQGREGEVNKGSV